MQGKLHPDIPLFRGDGAFVAGLAEGVYDHPALALPAHVRQGEGIVAPAPRSEELAALRDVAQEYL
jgi:hypothetical protein